MNKAEHHDLVRAALADKAAFVRLTLSGPAKGSGLEWEKVVARPVEIKDGRRIQFTFTGAARTEARNCTPAEARRELDRLLAMPFANISVQSVAEELHIRITRKGRVLVSRGKPSVPARERGRAHDRAKQYPLAAEGPDGFLEAIGIKNARGEVFPSMQAKFRQVNGFISLVEPILEDPPRGPLAVVDCGCGSAHLTFALFHYLRHVRGLEVRLVGIDRNAEVIARASALRDRLGWEELRFETAEIGAYRPEAAPGLVLSLHACDTATDEALALGVRWGSRAMVAAPCCQHELHHQLKAPAFEAVTRHGILRERLSDILTDAFRATALRVMGYRTEVVEFVAPEFTPKNLLLRAVRGPRPGQPDAVRAYLELKRFWAVEPAIERLAGEALREHIGRVQLSSQA